MDFSLSFEPLNFVGLLLVNKGLKAKKKGLKTLVFGDVIIPRLTSVIGAFELLLSRVSPAVSKI